MLQDSLLNLQLHKLIPGTGRKGTKDFFFFFSPGTAANYHSNANALLGTPVLLQFGLDGQYPGEFVPGL